MIKFLLILLSAVSLFSQNRSIGTNITFVKDWSTQWIFVDAMKQSRVWYTQDLAGQTWSVDSVQIPQRYDGYPTQIPFTHYNKEYRVHTLVLREIFNIYPSGTYTLLFEGTGEIILEFDTPRKSFTTAGTHTFEVNPSDGGIHLIINKSDINDPIRNIRIIMPGFENTYESNPFHPKFLELLEPFETLRFMPAQATSGTDIEKWEDRTTKDYYTQSDDDKGSLSYEYIAEICNTSNKNAWINIPYKADNNYIQKCAELMKELLNPNLKLSIEYANETWNTAWPYYKGHSHCSNMGKQLGLSTNDYEAALLYTSYRSLEIFDIFENVFGSSDQLVKVLASQAANVWTGTRMLEALDDPNINPKNIKADAFAIAPYFGGSVPDKLGDLGLIESITIDEIIDSTLATMRRTIPIWMNDYNQLTQQYNVDLIAYEGGQHLVAVRYQNNETLTQKLNEANRHPRMKDLYCEYFDYWYNNGGELFANFTFVESYSKWGSFGILEYMDQDIQTAYKWQAIQECVLGNNTTSIDLNNHIPNNSKLSNNYPNPFNPSTNISYEIKESSNVTIKIYDLLGNEIKTLVNDFKNPGKYIINFDGSNLSSGTYFYKIITNNFSKTKKMLLIK